MTYLLDDYRRTLPLAHVKELASHADLVTHCILQAHKQLGVRIRYEPMFEMELNFVVRRLGDCLVIVSLVGDEWHVWEAFRLDQYPAGRYWIYRGRSEATFITAVRQAKQYGWGEPLGWSHAWDGRMRRVG